MRKLILMMLVVMIIGIQNVCGAVTIEDNRSPFHEKVFYPLVRMEDKTIEKKINGAIIAEVDRFVTMVYRNAEKIDATVAGIHITYDVPCNEAGNTVILSIVFTESNYYEGAAHPATYNHALNFNTSSGELMGKDYLLEVGEGLREGYLIERLEQKLREQSARENIYLFPDALPLKKLPEDFYWDSNLHVHFIFQHYEIAPYAAGIIDVDIDD